jgi:ParB family transcriptional regulator, chromosome partitioning protein
MAKRPALGRGLAALLGEGADDGAAAVQDVASTRSGLPAETGVVDLPVGVIRRNPRQPRRVFESAALEELAMSIASVGVVQPVIVRKVEDGYELIAGERRWRAAQQAGYTVIPAIIRSASDVESLELALVENVVRQQLNPVDEAYALRVLLEDLGATQESLAARVGKSRSAIANKMRLLELPAAVQESLASGALSEGHGRALLGLTERGEQLQLARRAADKGMSVRQVEAEVRRLTEKPKSPGTPAGTELDPEFADEVREAFFSSLGVVPRVKIRGRGGVVEVPFKDAEELENLVRRLGR